MVVQIFAGFLSAVAFAHIYHVPRPQLFRTGVVGGLGWIVYWFTRDGLGETAGMFLAATLVALLSEFLARKCKQPVLIFLIPGVIPLVPGGKAYLTMLTYLQGDYTEGTFLLVSTILLAGAVAAGIIVSSSIFRVLPRAKRSNRRLIK